MNDNDDVQVFRQWMILHTLAARRFGMSVREMAEDRHVVPKTIRRDLEMLQHLGFSLAAAIDERGRKMWKLSQSDGCPPLRFTHDEAVALSMARRLLEPLCGTELWQAADRALRKIQSTLSEQAQEHFKKLRCVFHFTNPGLGNDTSKANIIDELTLAIEDGTAVDLSYQSQQASAPATRELHPYRLISHKGSLYLLAFAPAHNQPRLYKVARIDGLTVGSTRFRKPSESELAGHLAGSFGIYDGDDDVTVVVKFLPPAARYVGEQTWLPAHERLDQSDGSLVARFELTSTVEIKSWILSFGASALILEPEALRQEVAEDLEQLLEAYRPTPAAGQRAKDRTNP
jgi:predicted DNA-binding transcriptional regulator YafY